MNNVVGNRQDESAKWERDNLSMRSRLSFAAFLALAVCGIQAAAMALDFDTTPKGVTWTLVEGEVQGEPGKTVTVHVKGLIPEGWHTYSLKTYTKLGGPSPTKIVIEPKDAASLVLAEVTFDQKPHIDSEWDAIDKRIQAEAFEGTVTVAVPIKIADNASGESLKLSISMASSICDKEHCLKETVTVLAPIVLLKKKVNEPAMELTFSKKTISTQLDFAMADQELKIAANPGSLVRFHIKATVQNPWHTFATVQVTPNVAVTAFTVEPKEMGTIEGEITTDRPYKTHFDQEFHGDVRTFEDVVFSVPVRLSSTLKPGNAKLTFKITSQACTDKQCRQKKATVESDVTIAENAVATPTPAAAPASSGDDVKDARGKGLAAFLWIAAFYGMVALLTPCVFPMIPITVSFFTKRQHISHARAVRDALIFQRESC